MSTLYVVRHGQATFFDDDYDQLSAKGEQQSRLLGDFWIDGDYDANGFETWVAFTDLWMDTAHPVPESRPSPDGRCNRGVQDGMRISWAPTIGRWWALLRDGRALYPSRDQ